MTYSHKQYVPENITVEPREPGEQNHIYPKSPYPTSVEDPEVLMQIDEHNKE